MLMYIKYIHGKRKTFPSPCRCNNLIYDWCRYCYITISQFLTHRGQIHGGSESSKSRSCLKFTHVQWNNCRNLRSQFMLAS